MPLLHDYIHDFLEYLEIERGRSKLTIRNYDFYLTRFLIWLKTKIGQKPKPEDISLDQIRNFRLWLNRFHSKSNQELSSTTQNYHLIAMRSFLKYLCKRDIESLAPEKIELAKQPDRQVEFLEGSDLERLMEAPLKTNESLIVKLRDKAALELLFSTGMRVSELVGLKREQINLNKDELSIRGKGGKVRLVFLSSEARHHLKKYLDQRTDIDEALLVGHDRAAKAREKNDKVSRPLSARSVQRAIEYYRKVAGLTRKITPHTLRHSFATDLLSSGADIRAVQTLLGHASITTTQVYTHVTDKQLKDVYKAFHSRHRKG
ncbi:MAG: site-specific tyrosine recombinase/integron integrase [Patescibacteria group bacterium]